MYSGTPDLPGLRTPGTRASAALKRTLYAHREFGRRTQVLLTRYGTGSGSGVVETFVNEFWTAQQRQANNLHEISYRACFKPQLPRFFIDWLTRPGDRVYDPFMGRGTTLVEAALLNRLASGSDINPLASRLTLPRLHPPEPELVAGRLEAIPWKRPGKVPEELLVFYHPDTLSEIASLRTYLLERRAAGKLDWVDQWIEMVALNRLTGHSSGFFSVYTLPPNQAVSLKSQRKINADRKQVPPRRNVPLLIQKKSRKLLADLTPMDRDRLRRLAKQSQCLTGSADCSPDIPDRSVQLVVTSPPFLDVVDYATDNWLRCWFAGIDPASVSLSIFRKPADWQAFMAKVFLELHRVLRPGGYIAFEVGEVRSGTLRLEEWVLPAAESAGLVPLLVLINDQAFTKTANCWGVENRVKGTNTNRVVLLQKGA